MSRWLRPLTITMEVAPLVNVATRVVWFHVLVPLWDEWGRGGIANPLWKQRRVNDQNPQSPSTTPVEERLHRGRLEDEDDLLKFQQSIKMGKKEFKWLWTWDAWWCQTRWSDTTNKNMHLDKWCPKLARGRRIFKEEFSCNQQRRVLLWSTQWTKAARPLGGSIYSPVTTKVATFMAGISYRQNTDCHKRLQRFSRTTICRV